jgi:hypothetical protein
VDGFALGLTDLCAPAGMGVFWWWGCIGLLRHAGSAPPLPDPDADPEAMEHSNG